jgi:hypothetical protein
MMSEKEKEFLEQLEKAPDGVAKAFGYALYGMFKAAEVAGRCRRR